MTESSHIIYIIEHVIQTCRHTKRLGFSSCESRTLLARLPFKKVGLPTIKFKRSTWNVHTGREKNVDYWVTSFSMESQVEVLWGVCLLGC